METDEAKTEKTKRKFGKKGCLGCLGVLTGLFILIWILGSFVDVPDPEVVPSETTTRVVSSPNGRWIPDQTHFAGSRIRVAAVDIYPNRIVRFYSSYSPGAGEDVVREAEFDARWETVDGETRIHPDWLPGGTHYRYINGRLFLYDLNEMQYELHR